MILKKSSLITFEVIHYSVNSCHIVLLVCDVNSLNLKYWVYTVYLNSTQPAILDLYYIVKLHSALKYLAYKDQRDKNIKPFPSGKW